MMVGGAVVAFAFVGGSSSACWRGYYRALDNR